MQSNYQPPEKEFAVSPLPGSTAAFLMFAGMSPFLVLGGMLMFGRMEPTGLLRMLPVAALVLLVVGLVALTTKRRSVVLAGGVLEVRAAMYRERTPVAAIDLARARAVDLAERTELRPWLKTNGMALPGFLAGRFRLRGKLGKVFCLVTDRQRVLWLPLNDGSGQLLLSVERPQALLDALRAVTT